jgi:asparagine synthase (glutamine-hydrolysing)
VAEIYGTDHHEFDLNPEEDLENAILDLSYYSDEPSADAGALPVWFLSRMTRRQVTVALSGEGADELFGGYLTYVAGNLARPLRMMPKGLRRLLRKGVERLMPVSDEKIGLDYKIKRFLEGSELHPDEAHFFWNGTFSKDQRIRLLLESRSNGLRRLVDDLEIDDVRSVERYLLTDQQYYLADDILYKTDRMSMAHSLEVRPPFMDHRIVEFAASLPPRFKIRGQRQKVLLKDLMRSKLPDAVIDRKKTGFDIPTHDWFRGPLRQLLRDTLTPEAIRDTGVFRAAAVEDLIRSHLERRTNVGYHLWGLVTLFLWMRRWNVSTAGRYSTELAGARAFHY